jgi:DNA-binding NtrC family response regulator
VQYNKPVTPVSPELSHQFLSYDWPGNVRQLENLIKRMVVLGTEAGVSRELLQPVASTAPRRLTASSAPRTGGATPPSAVLPPPAAAVAASARAGSNGVQPPAPVAGAEVASVSLKDIARSAAREAEKDLILRMLTRTRWNRKEAAGHLGISYKALLYKIKENGLDTAS